MATIPADELSRAERAWAVANPAGRAERAPNGAIALYNFAIGSAVLKPEHIEALTQFVAPLVLARGTGRVGFVVTGYASKTGSEPENSRIALTRAKTVADWLEKFGFPPPSIDSNPTAEPIAGDDGESLARNRRVEVLYWTAFAPPSVSAPVFTPTMVPPDSRDLVEARNEQLEAMAPPSWVPQTLIEGITLPDAEYARIKNQFFSVRVRFEGSLRVKGGRGGTVVSAVSKEGNRLEIAVVRKVTENLAAKFVFEQANPARGGRPNVGVGIVGFVQPREGQYGLAADAEFRVQVTRWPDEFFYLSIGWSEVLPISLDDGASLTVLISGKWKFDFGPGPATLAAVARASSAAVAAAPEIGLASVLITTAVTPLLLPLAVRDAEAAGLARAARISARQAFGARLAYELVGPDWRSLMAALISEWRKVPDAGVQDSVKRAYDDAGRQVEALRREGSWPARSAELVARHGGAADFEQLRLSVFSALGGLDAEGPMVFSISTL